MNKTVSQLLQRFNFNVRSDMSNNIVYILVSYVVYSMICPFRNNHGKIN